MTSSPAMTQWNKEDISLRQAVLNGDIAHVKTLVNKKHTNPWKISPHDGKSTVHFAASCASVDVLTALLVYIGRDIDTKDEHGKTALHYAAMAGRHDLMRRLLSLRADPKVIDSDGFTVLHHACSSGNMDCIQQLLTNRQLVNHKDKEGKTPLIHAASKGRASVCRLLLENGADVNAADVLRRSALMAAAQNGHQAVCEYLVVQGADLDAADSAGRTVTWYAEETQQNYSAVSLSSQLDTVLEEEQASARNNHNEPVSRTNSSHSTSDDCQSSNVCHHQSPPLASQQLNTIHSLTNGTGDHHSSSSGDDRHQRTENNEDANKPHKLPQLCSSFLEMFRHQLQLACRGIDAIQLNSIATAAVHGDMITDFRQSLSRVYSRLTNLDKVTKGFMDGTANDLLEFFPDYNDDDPALDPNSFVSAVEQRLEQLVSENDSMRKDLEEKDKIIRQFQSLKTVMLSNAEDRDETDPGRLAEVFRQQMAANEFLRRRNADVEQQLDVLAENLTQLMQQNDILSEEIIALKSKASRIDVTEVNCEAPIVEKSENILAESSVENADLISPNNMEETPLSELLRQQIVILRRSLLQQVHDSNRLKKAVEDENADLRQKFDAIAKHSEQKSSENNSITPQTTEWVAPVRHQGSIRRQNRRRGSISAESRLTKDQPLPQDVNNNSVCQVSRMADDKVAVLSPKNKHSGFLPPSGFNHRNRRMSVPCVIKAEPIGNIPKAGHDQEPVLPRVVLHDDHGRRFSLTFSELSQKHILSRSNSVRTSRHRKRIISTTQENAVNFASARCSDNEEVIKDDRESKNANGKFPNTSELDDEQYVDYHEKLQSQQQQKRPDSRSVRKSSGSNQADANNGIDEGTYDFLSEDEQNNIIKFKGMSSTMVLSGTADEVARLFELQALHRSSSSSSYSSSSEMSESSDDERRKSNAAGINSGWNLAERYQHRRRTDSSERWQLMIRELQARVDQLERSLENASGTQQSQMIINDTCETNGAESIIAVQTVDIHTASLV